MNKTTLNLPPLDNCKCLQWTLTPVRSDISRFIITVLLHVNLHQVLLSLSKSPYIMNPARRIISVELCYLLVTLLTMGMQSLPVPTDIPMCTASEPAHYQLIFTGKWSRSAFPKQYPVHRPPAQWSNIVGKSSATTDMLGWKLVPVKENK